MPLSRFFAATYDRGLRRAQDAGLRERRARLLAGLEGDVLEVGAGTGLNLEHYPAGVRLVLAEPDPHMRRLLVDRLGESSRHATVVEATAEALPFADNSFDAVVSTLVLCSVHSVQEALAEIRRVLRAEGALLLIEHVRGTGGRAFLQEVVAPVSRLLFSCSPDRRTADDVRAAGFELEDMPFELTGGAPWTKPAIEGVAIRVS